MRSFLQVADIERGFESVPRILIRWLLRQAGVEGWNWLTADIALGSEHVRVRVGQLIGALATLEHNSIGQGKQSGVHLFGLYTKTLISAVLLLQCFCEKQSYHRQMLLIFTRMRCVELRNCAFGSQSIVDHFCFGNEIW